MSAPPYASASLYVGDLHSDVTEAQLFELFKQVGPVASIRVCRDVVTRRSLGYAYVNFHNVSDAERALDTLNYTKILSKPCRIMWSHRDPTKRKSGVGNVFIKNLDRSIDHQNLYDTFSAFGNILSCKVELDNDSVGSSKGYGYVHYETEEEANMAIQKVNGMMLAGQVVYVHKFKPKKEREQEAIANFTDVFVKNLDPNVADEVLRDAFEKYGPIQSCVVMKEEGKSKGFGFINFTHTEYAKKAVTEMNGQRVGDLDIYCGRAQKKSERQHELKALWEQRKLENMQKYQGVNLYVKNLDDLVTSEQLKKEFSHCGNISSAKIMRDEKGNSRGFGFVCFTTPEEATKAVTEMNGVMLNNKPIYVALAQRKEVRKAQLEAQHAQRQASLRMAGQNGLPSPGAFLGGPVFFPPQQPGVNPRMPSLPYQTNVVPRRWNTPGAPQGAGSRPVVGQYPPQPMPNYSVPPAQRQPRGQNRRGVPNQGPPPLGGKRVPQDQGANVRAFKYTPTARNQPSGYPVAGVSGPLPTPQELAAAPAEETKQILGERLFHQISKTHSELSGKLTGMILESMDNAELLGLLEEPQALQSKVQEAVEVLKDHMAKNQEAEGQDDATPGEESQ